MTQKLFIASHYDPRGYLAELAVRVGFVVVEPLRWRGDGFVVVVDWIRPPTHLPSGFTVVESYRTAG